MKKMLVFLISIIVLTCIVFLVASYCEPRYESEERHLAKDNLLFCFSISQFGGGHSTYYQVGKDGTLLRGNGYAESSYITDRGYFLTYEEAIAYYPNTTFTREDFGIIYDEIKLSAEQVKELEILLDNCMNNVEEGTEKIDSIEFGEAYVHALFSDGKVYYEWVDRRGYKKDPLSLIGYKLEELYGVKGGWYQYDALYFEEVKDFLRKNESFVSQYGKPKKISRARDWPIKRDNNGENWRPFVVETRKYQMVVYIRFGGRNPNGEIYMYEFEVKEISKK
ncbi:MAG: hypothetical protein E7619_01520 [Ruminococcaceae bacterium]|nr:hypothetical protein [Oscillospiraceae bacterium]